MQDVLGRSWKLPRAAEAEEAYETFSPTEKMVFVALVGLFILSSISLLWKVNNAFLVTVPEEGGTLEEGIIGSPRFVNPLLAISDADRDLTTLVYSGLMRATPDGRLAPDLAEAYSVSPDGLIYDFVLRQDARFHDGRPVTADDVVFTIEKARDPMLKSPKRVNWEGVTVEKVSDREVRFMLREPFAPFLENATLGILPRGIWENITSEEFPFSNFNVEPVGSGPYKVKSLKRDSGGIPVYYHLKPFDRFANGSPFVANLIIKFYDNQDELVEAYRDGSIESMHGISPSVASTLGLDAEIERIRLPRVFGVYFNQNQSGVFTDASVRSALSLAVDRGRLVREVLMGYGEPADGPIPPGHPLSSADGDPNPRLDEAAALLADAGWKRNAETGILEKGATEPTALRFSISTGNAPELKRAAELVAEDWRKLGADVEVLVFEIGDLNQNVIRSRKYDALLFGQVVGRDLDLYPFWHSSQRNDPGLNVAQYASIKADKLLEEARATTDPALRADKNREIEAEIRAEHPAVFLYSPHFLYVLPDKVKGVSFGQIATPTDRFAEVHDWYIETNKVWEIFAHSN